MSQTEAAQITGFTQAYLSQLENDKAVSPPLHTISKLAVLYKVSIDYLVFGEKNAA